MDGKLDLKGRVGLPPSGIFGIPFNITSTATAPIVKLTKGCEGDTFHETIDKEKKESHLIVSNGANIALKTAADLSLTVSPDFISKSIVSPLYE